MKTFLDSFGECDLWCFVGTCQFDFDAYIILDQSRLYLILTTVNCLSTMCSHGLFVDVCEPTFVLCRGHLQKPEGYMLI